MERFHFYFAQDKTHVLGDEDINALKLKDYEIYFGGSPAFYDATIFLMTQCPNDILWNQVKKLGPDIIMALNNQNFTNFSEVSKKLPLNKSFKIALNVNIYGNVLLTSGAIIRPEIKALVKPIESVKFTL